MEDTAKQFPPSQPEDLAVRLKLGAPDTINCKVYPLARNKIQAAAEFTCKNKELGRIRKVNSPWGSPFFFIKKKDGSLRPVQNYQTVNSWMERDVYPMPRIEQILEQLHGKVLFTTFVMTFPPFRSMSPLCSRPVRVPTPLPFSDHPSFYSPNHSPRHLPSHFHTPLSSLADVAFFTLILDS